MISARLTHAGGHSSRRYTSHEVTVDDEQLAWFETLLEEHPSTDGWKIIMFTHAPPIGSGLRVLQVCTSPASPRGSPTTTTTLQRSVYLRLHLQENHVVNGCCWLNHSSDTCAKFIALVRTHRLSTARSRPDLP
jgi:hypothetical protein